MYSLCHHILLTGIKAFLKPRTTVVEVLLGLQASGLKCIAIVHNAYYLVANMSISLSYTSTQYKAMQYMQDSNHCWNKCFRSIPCGSIELKAVRAEIKWKDICQNVHTGNTP